MIYTREELAEIFRQLDSELRSLASSDAPEEERWRVVEDMAHVPASAVSEEDRLWWWQQLYDALERHGLTELGAIARTNDETL